METLHQTSTIVTYEEYKTEKKSTDSHPDTFSDSPERPLYKTVTMVTVEERIKIILPRFRALFTIFYIVFILFDVIFRENDDFSISGMIISLFILLAFLWISSRLPKIIAKHISKSADAEVKPQKISFYDTYFVSEYLTSSARYQYCQLYKIKETKTNFYLMPAKQQYVVIIKANCSPELLEYLRTQKKLLNK